MTKAGHIDTSSHMYIANPVRHIINVYNLTQNNLATNQVNYINKCRRLLQLLVCLTQNNILDLVHVSFIHTLIPQFLIDGLVNILIFEEGNLCIHLGILDDRVRDDFWHLWVGGGFQCLSYDVWLEYIYVGCPKLPIQLLHHPR